MEASTSAAAHPRGEKGFPAVVRWLDLLSPAATEVIEVAAVIGGEFEVGLVASMAGASFAEVTELLAEASRWGARGCGRFHPANSMVVHEVVGKSALGVLFEEGPR